LNGAGQITGDVGGQLPGQLQFDNQTAFNDYFQGIQMFGNQVSFNLDLNGPTPLGGDSSGFNIAFYADDGSTPLLTNSPDGIVAQFVVNPDGSISPTTFPIADDIPENVVSYQIATTPEPRKLTWLGLLLFTGVFWLRRRQGTRWQHRS
jgi:hypothetical protein